MPLNERQLQRLRGVLQTVLRAEDAVADIADECARTGQTDTDAPLDATATHLRDLARVLGELIARGAR